MGKGLYFHKSGEDSSHYKHGRSNSRLYRIWSNMKTRCYSKSTTRKDWQNKGIQMCEEWRTDFKSFYDWAMANGYSDELTIDRIDNNGNYEPLNCRWTSYKEQSRNTSRNHYLTFKGQTKTICEWADELGINHRTLCARLNNYGWTIEKTLSTPVNRR